MCKIYLARVDNILRILDSDTWYIIYRDAGYITKRLYIGKVTKNILNKNIFLKHRLRYVPSQKRKKEKKKQKTAMIALVFLLLNVYFSLYFLPSIVGAL